MNVFSDRIKGLQPSAIREILKFTADPSVISFAAGNPAPEAFPAETLSRLSAEIFAEEPINALQYSISEGYAPLRGLLKNTHGETGVFNRSDDELIITSGAQQAIELLTKTVCNEGEVIICENPSFIGSLNSFRSYNAKIVGVPMDEDGMNIEILEEALKKNPRTAFIYVIPNFQNPTGNCTGLKRRLEILDLAYKYNVLVLEDNPYGDIRFSGKDIPNLKELDKKGHVIYVGSFSKTVAPGLRVGFMCGAKNIVQKAVAGLQVSTVHTNIWAQMLIWRFLNAVDFEEHLDNLRAVYKRKCALMLNSLKFSMPLSINFTEPEGGLFIWGTLPYGNMGEFCRRAVENKVAVVPGNAFLTNERETSLSFRLNFSTPTDIQIENGVEILSRVARGMFG